MTVTIPGPSSIFECFPDAGALTIDVSSEATWVFDNPDDAPVLIAERGDIALRPSAFSSGPDEWWSVEASTNADSVARLVGPIVSELALGGNVDQPNRQIAQLVATADSVEARGEDRFRVFDSNAQPTRLDVTLDADDHLAQLVVAQEDPQSEDGAGRTQVRYLARYRDGTEQDHFRPRATRSVDGAELDSLDNRPGVCDPVVGP